MRCMLCGEEMRLVRAVRDEAMLVPGFEHHVLSCPSCHDEETRLVFIEQRASLSPSGGMKAQALEAQPPSAARGLQHEGPAQVTSVRSEKMLPNDTPPPALPASAAARPRSIRSAGSKVWDLKAELHRARWGLLCGRLGLRISNRETDTPGGN